MTDSTTEAPLHVVGLEVDNIKKVRLVRLRLDPSGSLVVVGGDNAQGKTSLLDALEMALAGAGAIPPDPIRHGARKGRVLVDLGEIVVERTFSPKGTALTVTGKDGTPKKSPQALLDSLTSRVTFDPLEFSRMEPKKQDAVLKQLLGLDFSELDGDRAQIFARRTEENRELKKLEARLDSLPEPEAGVPAAEVSSKDLLARLDEMGEATRLNEAERAKLRGLETNAGETDAAGAKLEARIAELRQEISHLEAELGALGGARSLLAVQIQKQRTAVEALVEPDTATVRKQLADLETTNRKVRARQERDQLEKELRQRADKVSEMTEAIAYIDQKKQDTLAAAAFPVPDLGFDELGVTLNGVPLEQASGAEKLRVSVAIGAALNPRVKVMLVRDGSLLDSGSMRLLAELAASTGSQVFVERVGDGDAAAVVLEDGLVRGAATEAAE